MLFFAWGPFSLGRVKVTPAYSINNLRLHKRTQWGFVWFVQPPFPLGVIKKIRIELFRTLCSRFYSSSRVFLSFVKRRINKFLLGQGNRELLRKNCWTFFPDLINKEPAGITLDGRASLRDHVLLRQGNGRDLSYVQGYIITMSMAVKQEQVVRDFSAATSTMMQREIRWGAANSVCLAGTITMTITVKRRVIATQVHLVDTSIMIQKTTPMGRVVLIL